jgi:hypothetical protein
MKYIFLFPIVLILVCLTSCSISTVNWPGQQTPTILIGDGGLISQIPCGPPCFLGIVPGITSNDEALVKFNSRAAPAKCEEYDYSKRPGGGLRGVSCGFGGFIFGEDGYVSSIGFTPNGITLKQVIEKYGSPDSIKVGLITRPEDAPIMAMILRYDELQAVINLPSQAGAEYTLSEDVPIEYVRYIEKAEYAIISENAGGEPWRGYTSYNISDTP